MGRLSGGDRGSLAFCLEALAEGTAMAGAKVELDDAGPELACPHCGRFPVEGPAERVCPACGGPAELALNADVVIEEVELDVEEDQAATEG